MVVETLARVAIALAALAAYDHVKRNYYHRLVKRSFTPEQLERMWVVNKAAQIAQSRKRRAENVFAVAMMCNLEAAKTPEHKKFLDEIHEEFILAQANGNAEDINKLLDKLQAAAIFTGKLPILTDEQIVAEMVDLQPA